MKGSGKNKREGRLRESYMGSLEMVMKEKGRKMREEEREVIGEEGKRRTRGREAKEDEVKVIREVWR